MKAHVISPKVFRAAVFVLLALSLAGCATRPAANNTLESVGDVDALRPEALSLVNQDRRAQGLSNLRASQLLNAAAQAHAEDMARRGFYSHFSPEGRDLQDRYRALGAPDWKIIGENIASCRACAAPSEQMRRFQQQWMQSSGHRRNILDERYTQFGFGMAAANGRVYAVQTFVAAR